MAKTRTQKEQILARLQEDLQNRAVVLVDYQGLTVAEINGLRDQLFEQGYKMLVVKNTLLGKALKEQNLSVSDEAMSLPLAVVVAQDEVALAKLIEKFASDHEKITVVGAWVEGKFVDSSYVTKLSKLPGREELLAKLVGSINAPISGMVNVLAGNIRGLVNVIQQYSQKKN